MSNVILVARHALVLTKVIVQVVFSHILFIQMISMHICKLLHQTLQTSSKLEHIQVIVHHVHSSMEQNMEYVFNALQIAYLVLLEFAFSVVQVTQEILLEIVPYHAHSMEQDALLAIQLNV